MNRKVPTSVYVFVALLAAALAYSLFCLPHGDGKFNIQQTINDQRLHDAETALLEAQSNTSARPVRLTDTNLNKITTRQFKTTALCP